MARLDLDKAKFDIEGAKTWEEWQAQEVAERKTLKGKIKYAWEDYLYYPLLRLFAKPQNISREIKWFIQRGKRGYADCDTWALDEYLCGWLPSALRMMKDGLSYPGRPGANSVKEWDAILEKIAKGFEAGDRVWEVKDFKSKKYELLMAQKKEGLKLFAKWFDSLWN